MQKKALLVIIPILLISCASVNGIKKEEAYRLNQKFLEKKYNKKFNRKNTAFVIIKDIWHFETRTDEGKYELVIDKNGKILEDNFKAY